MDFDFDLIAIGSGPGGQKAAIQAAKLGKRAAVIDFNPNIGGVCLHDGTIPSKSFREAIMHLSGLRVWSHYGKAYRVKQTIEMSDLTRWSEGIIEEVEQTLRHQLLRNGVEIICGIGSFLDRNTVKIEHKGQQRIITARHIVIATGTKPRHPEGFQIDNDVVLDSNGILYMPKLPHSMTIIGGGVIGCEYASMFAALGLKITIVEAQAQLLSFVDHEIADAFAFYLREHRVTAIVNETVTHCARSNDGRAVTYLAGGKRIVSDVLLVSAGRTGNVERLNLQGVGISVNGRGHIPVNENCQTSTDNIYAVGDVIGHTNLASTSIEQGRRAACHAFGLPYQGGEIPFPSGIYSIPEIAMVGATERDLRKEKIPYETGIGRFKELERGKIIGDTFGMLKLLFNRRTRKLLGVHIIGESASELIHLGQSILAVGGTIDYFADAVLNYPTLTLSYKVAALDGLNKVIETKDILDGDEDTV
ncbi:MAG: Si-specific NAD(P)(+) transhydrogenase [Deltaproteobacteria bacterium]|nr:Si-specific NAD(P)(+) transhydrogenase [Deltaproteobacteria bacterium]